MRALPGNTYNKVNNESERGVKPYNADIAEDAAIFLADIADGDARAALNAIELAVLTTDPGSDGRIHITLKVAEECIQKNVEHPITDRLIRGGYKQPAGGYILIAKRAGIKNPTQYWHLIHSWSDRSPENAPFDRRIKCGELLVFMAEVSGAVAADKLNDLCDRILSGDVTDRTYWNGVIQNVCFDAVVDAVTRSVA